MEGAIVRLEKGDKIDEPFLLLLEANVDHARAVGTVARHKHGGVTARAGASPSLGRRRIRQLKDQRTTTQRDGQVRGRKVEADLFRERREKAEGMKDRDDLSRNLTGVQKSLDDAEDLIASLENGRRASGWDRPCRRIRTRYGTYSIRTRCPSAVVPF